MEALVLFCIGGAAVSIAALILFAILGLFGEG
jgi:hypothetical protein